MGQSTTSKNNAGLNSSLSLVATWKVEKPGGFEVSQDPNDATKAIVQVTSARGLVEEAYEGSFDSNSDMINVVFSLTADGFDVNGKKQFIYQSAVYGASAETAVEQAPTQRSGGQEAVDWGDNVEDFDGLWQLPGGGEILIRHGTQVQLSSVEGIQNMVFQGTFETGRIDIIFTLVDNGHQDDDPTKPRELLFWFPEILLPGSGGGLPVEGELFIEETTSGGG